MLSPFVEGTQCTPNGTMCIEKVFNESLSYKYTYMCIIPFSNNKNIQHRINYGEEVSVTHI